MFFGKKVLNLGCWCGGRAVSFAEKWNVESMHGIDVNKYFIEAAKLFSSKRRNKKIKYDFKVGFDAAWELDFWGRFRRGVESAQAGLGATLTNYDDILVSLTAEVASTYVNLRIAEERLAVAYENLEIQKLLNFVN